MKVYDEVETHPSLPQDHPARLKAREILDELEADKDLRQALLPEILRVKADRVGDWCYVWSDFEQQWGSRSASC